MNFLTEQQIIDTKLEYLLNPEKLMDLNKNTNSDADILTTIGDSISKELSMIGHVLLVKDFATNKIKVINPCKYKIERSQK